MNGDIDDRTANDTEQLYYIQFTGQGFVGNCMLLWRPNGNGYTTELDKAGLYTTDRLENLRDTDQPWKQETLRAAAVLHVRGEGLFKSDVGLSYDDERGGWYPSGDGRTVMNEDILAIHPDLAKELTVIERWNQETLRAAAVLHVLCERGSCAHPDDHGVISPLCGVDACSCGESTVIDTRVQRAIRGQGWTMTDQEAKARGFNV